MDKIIEQLTSEFSQRLEYIKNIVALIDEGNTIPFIARYRKEMHGSMDDQILRDVSDRLQYLRNLDARRLEIINSIDSQGKLTDELTAAINGAITLSKLEDIYRPYKQKRRTRATIAREKGLEPLSEILFSQTILQGSLDDLALDFIDLEKGVNTVEEALAGASDIIAEEISDNAEIRGQLRQYISERGNFTAVASKETEDSVYSLYYDFSDTVSKMQSHRILAINRGEKEGFIKVSVEIGSDSTKQIIKDNVLKSGSISTDFVATAAEDAYDRLLFPSLEREIRNNLTDIAHEQAIKMFALNLRPALMQPPIKNMVVMGFDPAYRTGCKIAVVDGTGMLLETSVVYPTKPHNREEEARATLTRMIKKHGVTAIAIGNGTASKESEIFVADMIKDLPGVSYMVVNEAGASVYSASKLAASEFPNLDVSLRSAASIARRLQDPLAELVKIDPKSIGVGQYQHDMPAARLDETLSDVVEDCVNAVGVDINTASSALLSYISGLSAATAGNIVAHREESGVFTSRSQIKKVPKIGPKAFEQCAGFLRVSDGKNILDNTGVHPESYSAAEKILEICGYSLSDVASGNVSALKERVKELTAKKVAEHCGSGIPTVNDIVNELLKPGRDPRDELPPTMLRTDVMDINDLASGMKMRGTVRNVIDFGVFVDIGVHQDGLVHISELCNRFIKHPSEVVKVGDVVNTVVLSVDVAKNRISLSMKQANQ